MKIKALISLFLLIWCKSTFGQVDEFKTGSDLRLEAFSYPEFLRNEQHKELIFAIGVFENMKIELQGFYDVYLLENRSRGSIIIKRYFNENFYTLIGAEAEWRQGKSLVPAGLNSAKQQTPLARLLVHAFFH